MRALPEITAENAAYWAGGQDNELRIAFCGDCNTASHPPQIICIKCLSRNMAPRAVSGTGIVYSFTVNHQPWLPDMQVPFAIAVVDLDDAGGVRITAQVETDAPEKVAIGQAMQVAFHQAADHIWIPVWRPIPSAGASA